MPADTKTIIRNFIMPSKISEFVINLSKKEARGLQPGARGNQHRHSSSQLFQDMRCNAVTRYGRKKEEKTVECANPVC